MQSLAVVSIVLGVVIVLFSSAAIVIHSVDAFSKTKKLAHMVKGARGFPTSDRKSFTAGDIISGERLLAAANSLKNRRVKASKYEVVASDLVSYKDHVLVTHQSDASISDQLLREAPCSHWLGSNVVSGDRAKSTCIPIGIADKRWSHGDAEVLARVANRFAGRAKTKLCYLNISVETNAHLRKRAKRAFEGKAWVTSPKRRLAYEQYLSELGEHMYAVAPRGNGPDTHRVWECAYLGVVPIVLRSDYTQSCLAGIQVLAVDSWDELDESTLRERYKTPRDPRDVPVLRLGHWKTVMKETVQRATRTRGGHASASPRTTRS